MKSVTIAPSDAKEGSYVTVWYGDGNCGQGGSVILNDRWGISINAPGDRVFTWAWTDVHHIITEVPHDADECLDHGPDCSGPVDLVWAGGTRSWPRCTHHGELRRRRYEDGIERYADSDVAPSWFDPAYAGERWEDE